jgi:desulfoferrodoxin-like iron-binding protein
MAVIGSNSSRMCPAESIRRTKGSSMASENEYYVCDICGMVVQVKHDGSGTLTCCSEDMRLVTEEEAKKLIAQ